MSHSHPSNAHFHEIMTQKSVAATPPYSAIRFRLEIDLRHLEQLKFSLVAIQVRRGLFWGHVGGVARHPCEISKTADIRCDTVFNKLKTTPTPNKNSSYGIKGGFVCHKSRSSYAIKVGSCTIFSVKVPLFGGIFAPYDPSFYGIFWGHIFC